MDIGDRINQLEKRMWIQVIGGLGLLAFIIGFVAGIAGTHWGWPLFFIGLGAVIFGFVFDPQREIDKLKQKLADQMEEEEMQKRAETLLPHGDEIVRHGGGAGSTMHDG